MNVALIGHGYWGKILEKYIVKDFNLKYVCDSKSDLNEVWGDKDCTSVIVAVRNEQRYSIVKQALLSGKNVLAEKPLALKWDEAQELAVLADKNDLSLVIDYTFTVSKGLLLASELVKQGKIGDLLGFDMAVNHLAPFGGGSVYWILGSHTLSVLNMFIPLESLSYKKHDIVIHNGEIETGVIVTNKGQIHLSLNYPDKTVEVVLYGSKGTIVYNPNKTDSLIVDNYERKTWVKMPDVPHKREICQFDESDNLKYIMAYFKDVIKGKAQSNVDTALMITNILEGLQND
jgi:predicted dehydrogenase